MNKSLTLSIPDSGLNKQSLQALLHHQGQRSCYDSPTHHNPRQRGHLSLQNRSIFCKWKWNNIQSHTTVDKGILVLCNSRQKQLYILSLFASNFTKEKLLQFEPPLTQPKIDAAKKNAPMKGPEQILDNLRYTENVWPDRIATLSEICFNAFDFQSSRLCYHATSLVKWKKKSKSHYKCYES